MNYFSLKEQTCHCGCGLNKVYEHPGFLQKLNTMRELCGFPLVATCMTRCKKHNAEVGGAPNSAHPEGLAADLKCYAMHTRYKMLEAALAAGFRRIEISAVHMHVDDDPTKEQEIIMLKLGKEIV